MNWLRVNKYWVIIGLIVIGAFAYGYSKAASIDIPSCDSLSMECGDLREAAT